MQKDAQRRICQFLVLAYGYLDGTTVDYMGMALSSLAKGLSRMTEPFPSEGAMENQGMGSST